MLQEAYAMGQNPGVQQGAVAPNPIIGLMPIILMFVIFYFLLILPQQKKQKQHLKMLAAVKKNDEVVTSGGIHGKVVDVKDDAVIMEIDDNCKIKVQKSSISFIKKTS